MAASQSRSNAMSQGHSQQQTSYQDQSVNMNNKSRSGAVSGGFSVDDAFDNDKVRAMKELLRRDNIPDSNQGYSAPFKKSTIIKAPISTQSGINSGLGRSEMVKPVESRVVLGANTGLSLG